MKKISLILISSVLFLSASTTINKDNTWGCVTLDKNTELNNALIDKDKHARDYLLSYSCVVLYKGQHVTIVDDSMSKFGLLKVRVYPKNKRPKEIWIETWHVDKK